MSKPPIKMPTRKLKTPADSAIDSPAPPVLPTRKKQQTCNAPTRTKPRRKIDAAIIAQMAQAVATMLTETEAARLSGIEPRHWFEWKSRAGRDGKFVALLEEFRANKIAGLLDRVQKSADGVGVKFPDFRAALALLKFQDHKRFGDSPTVEINNHPPTSPLMLDAMKRVYALPATMPAMPLNSADDDGTGSEAVPRDKTAIKQLPASASSPATQDHHE